MRHCKLLGIIFSGFFLIVLFACSYPISRGLRQEAAEDLTFSKVLANPTAYHGKIIIWGGVIIKNVDQAEGSDLLLWETPLEFGERPKGREFSEGKFIARSRKKLDPQDYATDRKVTVAGEIIGEELGKSDSISYVYPLVKLREIYLWKTEPAMYKWNWGNIPYYWPHEFSPDQEYKPTR
jgi:outer membrane lipoprotein